MKKLHTISTIHPSILDEIIPLKVKRLSRYIFDGRSRSGAVIKKTTKYLYATYIILIHLILATYITKSIIN